MFSLFIILGCVLFVISKAVNNALNNPDDSSFNKQESADSQQSEEKDPDFDRRSVSVSAGLKTVYSRIAERRNHLFLAASDYVTPSVYDDEHLNAEGHSILAEAVFRTLSGNIIRERQAG